MPEFLLKIARQMPVGLKYWLQPLKHPMDPLIARRIHAASGDVVAQGLFKGLKFHGYHVVPCLLGTYEKEMYPAIERLLSEVFTDIVTVGAASGFYVAALAKRYPKSRHVAFEMIESLQSHIRENVRANAPESKLEVLGECRLEDLDNAIPRQGKSLVIVDVEGAELDLLDPSRIPQLSAATLLVETHDPLRPGCTEGMLVRFEQSHTIERIFSTERTLDDFPYPAMTHPRFMMKNAALRAMSEGRAGPQEWLVMTPRV